MSRAIVRPVHRATQAEFIWNSRDAKYPRLRPRCMKIYDILVRSLGHSRGKFIRRALFKNSAQRHGTSWFSYVSVVEIKTNDIKILSRIREPCHRIFSWEKAGGKVTTGRGEIRKPAVHR